MTGASENSWGSDDETIGFATLAAEAGIADMSLPERLDLFSFDEAHEVPADWFTEFDRRMHGLARHRHAFLYDEFWLSCRADLVPIIRVASLLFRGLIGAASIDVTRFRRAALMPFLEEAPHDGRAVADDRLFLGEARNWLADIITMPGNGIATPRRVTAVQVLIELLDLIPPVEPLSRRIAATRRTVELLLDPQHRRLLAEAPYRDVYELVERLAASVDADLLSDLCDATTRIRRPITVLDEIAAHEQGASTPPPSADEIITGMLLARAQRTETEVEVPEDLAAALGQERVEGLRGPIDWDDMQAQALAWVNDATARGEVIAVRHWLHASLELALRVGIRDENDPLHAAFSYEPLIDAHLVNL